MTAAPALDSAIAPPNGGRWAIEAIGIDKWFGPVHANQDVTLRVAKGSIHGIVGHPQILKALSPSYAAEFLAGHFGIAFFALVAFYPLCTLLLWAAKGVLALLTLALVLHWLERDLHALVLQWIDRLDINPQAHLKKEGLRALA